MTPRKIRRAVLILAGYVFFWSFSRWLVVYLIGVTTLIYGIGRHMDHLKAEGKKKAKEQGAREPRTFIKKQYKSREKRTLIAGILLLLGILGYLKYCNFFVTNINHILEMSGRSVFLQPQTLLVPIGISFYTLEAVGYMADVYWGRIHAEKNWAKIALFLGFFPQIMEGPIVRGMRLLMHSGMCTSTHGKSCTGSHTYCMGNVQEDRSCRQTLYDRTDDL